MKKVIAAAVVIGALVFAGVFARQAVERDREYQRLIRQGDAALDRGQTFVAIESFSGAIALKRTSMLAYLKRGDAHRRRGDSTETLGSALRDLRTAAELDPGATKVQEELGDINFQMRRYGNAAQAYAAYLRLDDRSPAVLYKLALAYRGDGQMANAITALRDALRLNPGFAEAHYMLGVCLKERGQTADALSALERAIDIAPALIPAHEELADLQHALGNAREEIEQLEALAALDPTRAERLIDVGLAYARAGSPETAVTILGRAAERFQDYPGVYAALGEVWLGAAEERNDKAALRKALEALEPVASRSTANSEILGLFGRALALNGQATESEAVLRQAAATFPVDPAVLPEYATVAERAGHLEEARQALVRYTVLLTADDSVRDQAERAARIGNLSLQLNDAATAVTWFERSNQLSPADGLLLARLADAQLRLGRTDVAASTIARAVQKDPKNPLVRAVELRIQRVAQAVPEKVESEN